MRKGSVLSRTATFSECRSRHWATSTETASAISPSEQPETIRAGRFARYQLQFLAHTFANCYRIPRRLQTSWLSFAVCLQKRCLEVTAAHANMSSLDGHLNKALPDDASTPEHSEDIRYAVDELDKPRNSTARTTCRPDRRRDGSLGDQSGGRSA